MMAEEWKPIAGYEGLYEVSNYGKVRSIDHMRRVTGTGRALVMGQALKPFDTSKGNPYQRVRLSKEGKQQNVLVHRIVAQAFIPNPGSLPMVNHKDENPRNNRVDNLEWCDAVYNRNYGTAIERAAAKMSRPIAQLSLSGEFIREWPSVSAASRACGIPTSNICLILNNTPRMKPSGHITYRTHAGGYKWKYLK